MTRTGWLRSPAVFAGLTSAFAAPDKFKITAEEHAACDGDAIRLCAMTYSDQDKLLACMKANREQLSPVCRTT